jgi:hypothetical protein
VKTYAPKGIRLSSQPPLLKYWAGLAVNGEEIRGDGYQRAVIWFPCPFGVPVDTRGWGGINCLNIYAAKDDAEPVGYLRIRGPRPRSFHPYTIPMFSVKTGMPIPSERWWEKRKRRGGEDGEGEAAETAET